MEIKKFKELSKEHFDFIIQCHYSHWVKFNPLMDINNTRNKFQNIYTNDVLPFGIALFDKETLIGFCVFKIENLKKYPQFFPWISDIMIFEEYRGKGYGKFLVEEATKYLNSLGYDKVYIWTDQTPDFYKKLGFRFLQMVEKNEGGFGELFVK